MDQSAVSETMCVCGAVIIVIAVRKEGEEWTKIILGKKKPRVYYDYNDEKKGISGGRN